MSTERKKRFREGLECVRGATVCPCVRLLERGAHCWACGKVQVGNPVDLEPETAAENFWMIMNPDYARRHWPVLVAGGRSFGWTVRSDGTLYDKSVKRREGCLTPEGYRQVKIGGSCYYVHRLVCRTFHGPPPCDKWGRVFDCDHIDFDRENNSPLNLRWMPQDENRPRHDEKERTKRRKMKE